MTVCLINKINYTRICPENGQRLVIAQPPILKYFVNNIKFRLRLI